MTRNFSRDLPTIGEVNSFKKFSGAQESSRQWGHRGWHSSACGPFVYDIVALAELFGLRLRVNLRAFLDELFELFFHASLKDLCPSDALFGGVFPRVFGGFHFTWRIVSN